MLGALDPRTGTAREWHSPGSARAAPHGIAVAPDGRIVYDEASTGVMVAFTPATERMETVTIPTRGAIVRNMSADSTRGIVWLALSGTARLGKLALTRQPGR